jgi:hypothetical protein
MTFRVGHVIRCGDCRYWGEQDKAYRHDAYRRCTHPKVFDSYYKGLCPPDGVFCGDAEWIETGPDFGCVHGEAK